MEDGGCGLDGLDRCKGGRNEFTGNGPIDERRIKSAKCRIPAGREILGAGVVIIMSNSA
jgi:hypothetical protein